MQAKRLAIAFGSRGKGRALAHYEPARVVINLTKMKGAGSLAHEWGHAFDDWLGIKCGTYGLRTFLSENCTNRRIKESKYPKVIDVMKKVVETMRMKTISPDEVKRGIMAEQDEALETVMGQFTELKENNAKLISQLMQSKSEESLALTTKLQSYKGKDTESTPEFQELLDEFTAKQEIIVKLELAVEKYNEAIDNFESNPSYDTVLNIRNKAAELVDFVPEEERQKFWTSIFSYQLIREVRVYDRFGFELKTLDNNPDYMERKCRVKTKYYESAIELDKGRKQAYYSETVEMFARAFESYIEDSLNAQGMRSEYLVHSTSSNRFYNGYQPYPEGDERKEIDAAIKNLVDIAYKTFGDAYTVKANYSKVYGDKDKWESYQSNVSTIKLTKPRKTPQPANDSNATISSLQGLRDAIVSIEAQGSSKSSIITPKKYMDMIAIASKNKFGYGAIGAGDFKQYKAKGLGNSKSFVYMNIPNKGRAIMVDSSAKQEKQLEGLIEGVVRDVVRKQYGDSVSASMIAEGVTYTLCKKFNLDVRTYCLSENFDALAKDSKQSKSYLNICSKVYNAIWGTLFSK